MRTPTSEDHGGFVLVTDHTSLAEEVAVLAAVVGARLHHYPHWEQVPASAPDGGDWAALLCGPDAPPPASTPALGGESAVLMLSLGAEGRDRLWDAAAQGAGVTAVPLPEGEAWLREHLAARLTDQVPGRAAAMLGASGGAGTTTLSYLLAAESAAQGHRTLLVDADPRPGGGLGVLLADAGEQPSARSFGPRGNGSGSRGAPGGASPGRRSRGHRIVAGRLGAVRQGRLSWDDLTAAEGDISAAQLQTAAVPVDGFGLITGGGSPAPTTAEAVLLAARRAADLVVVDLGRREELTGLGRGRWDLAVVVAGADARGLEGARTLAAHLDPGVWGQAVCGGRRRDPLLSRFVEEVGLELLFAQPELGWLRRAESVRVSYDLLRTRAGARAVGDLVDRVVWDGPRGAARAERRSA